MHHSILSVLACESLYGDQRNVDSGHEPPRGTDYGVGSHESPDPGPGCNHWEWFCCRCGGPGCNHVHWRCCPYVI